LKLVVAIAIKLADPKVAGVYFPAVVFMLENERLEGNSHPTNYFSIGNEHASTSIYEPSTMNHQP